MFNLSFLHKNKALKKYTIIYSILLLGLIIGKFKHLLYIEIMCRTLLMICLFLYYNSQVKKRSNWYVSALTLTLVADICNTFIDTDLFLIISMVSSSLYFSIYAYFFLQKVKKQIPIYRVLGMFSIFAICMSVPFMVISSNLGIFMIIGLINCIILLFVCSLSFNNLMLCNCDHNLKYFSAFFLFITGNSMFGIYRFFEKIELLFIGVIILYAIAQYLIATALVDEQTKKSMQCFK